MTYKTTALLLCVLAASGCSAVSDIEAISLAAAQCKQEARKATNDDSRRAVLEEECAKRALANR